MSSEQAISKLRRSSVAAVIKRGIARATPIDASSPSVDNPVIRMSSEDDRTPPIVWRLRLAAAPDRVFAAWLSAGDHERFWCERSEMMPDGNFRQHFIDGTVATCAIEEWKAPDYIRMRYFDSQVEIHLARRGDGTDLTLIALGVERHHWNDVHAGWLNVLLPLKAWIDFDVDLRNHDPFRTWAQRYVDQ
jgi:uncharacterized protein YndB with AHSA1/START domain